MSGQEQRRPGADVGLPATARVGHFLVWRDPDPDPDFGPISWFVTDERDGAAMSSWYTYADAITDAMDRDAAEEAGGVKVVILSEAERERLLWWLYRPVPPSPEKDMDVRLIRKLERR
jgi:hypothetical protein